MKCIFANDNIIVNPVINRSFLLPFLCSMSLFHNVFPLLRWLSFNFLVDESDGFVCLLNMPSIGFALLSAC